MPVIVLMPLKYNIQIKIKKSTSQIDLDKYKLIKEKFAQRNI